MSLNDDILAGVDAMEYIDENLKRTIKDVVNSSQKEVNVIELMQFIITEHKHTKEQLCSAYTDVIYDNMRKLKHVGRWSSLGYISQTAAKLRIEALKNSREGECALAEILTETYELERMFSSLGLDDKRQLMEGINE